MFELAVRGALDSRFGIRRGDSVLDVGCGGMPFPLATHLADVTLTDDSARFGLPVPLAPRPVFECSVERMPFEDDEFDFVYCAHVLEHVDDPAAACRELMRVGRRGYVECPRSWVEYVFSAPDHRWLVDLERGVLVFREKTPAEHGDPLGIRTAIFGLLRHDDFRRHWEGAEMLELRTVRLHWEGSFDYLVVPAGERGVHHGAGPALDGPVRGQLARQALLTLATAEVGSR